MVAFIKQVSLTSPLPEAMFKSGGSGMFQNLFPDGSWLKHLEMVGVCWFRYSWLSSDIFGVWCGCWFRCFGCAGVLSSSSAGPDCDVLSMFSTLDVLMCVGRSPLHCVWCVEWLWKVNVFTCNIWFKFNFYTLIISEMFLFLVLLIWAALHEHFQHFVLCCSKLYMIVVSKMFYFI